MLSGIYESIFINQEQLRILQRDQCLIPVKGISILCLSCILTLSRIWGYTPSMEKREENRLETKKKI